MADAKLETPSGVIELPTVEGTDAPSGLDISKLMANPCIGVPDNPWCRGGQPVFTPPSSPR